MEREHEKTHTHCNDNSTDTYWMVTLCQALSLQALNVLYHLILTTTQR